MPGLSVNEVYAIHGLLEEEEQPLNQITNSFKSKLGSLSPLKVGFALLTLLEERDLLAKVSQRVIVIHLLSQLYGKEVSLTENPFLDVLLKLLKRDSNARSPSDELVGGLPELTQAERYFLSQILGGTAREVLLSKTPLEIANFEIPGDVPPVDTSRLEQTVRDSQGRYSSYWKEALPNLFRCPDKIALRDPAHSEQQAALQSLEAIFVGRKAPAFQVFRPRFLRLVPPIHYGEDEYTWIHDPQFERFFPHWEPDMLNEEEKSEQDERTATATTATATESSESTRRRSSSPSPTSSTSSASSDRSVSSSSGSSQEDKETLSFVQKAMNEPLLPTESDLLIKSLKNTTTAPAVVKKAQVTPEKLPKLIEQNPMVAVEILWILISHFPNDVYFPYFEVLVNMDVSLHGMEVVNRLTSVGTAHY